MTAKELLAKTKHALHCKYINNQMIADKLGVSRQSVSRKLNGNDCRVVEYIRIAQCGELLTDYAIALLNSFINSHGSSVKLSKALSHICDDEIKIS